MSSFIDLGNLLIVVVVFFVFLIIVFVKLKIKNQIKRADDSFSIIWKRQIKTKIVREANQLDSAGILFVSLNFLLNFKELTNPKIMTH